MFFTEYHKALDTLHFGTLAPRAYYIPFADKETALKGEREKSKRFSLLSGNWKFAYFHSFEDLRADVTLADYDFSVCDDITVPRCWQMYTDRDYDKPLYSNLQYPFPTDPPHVPDENPCGVYLRDFDVDADFFNTANKMYINLEGVASCFYLFVNGVFCAYSQVSHSTSEIDITGKLVSGKNRLCVIVVKWCDGSYLEDQDFFRLSGIFRDVYLLTRPVGHIEDIKISTFFSCGFDNCEVSVHFGEKDIHSGSYILLGTDGKSVADGSFNGNFSFTVDKPMLWNAEQPFLYTLLLHCADEYIPLQLGLRSVEIKNGGFTVNGKRTVIRGINRHDSNPDNGYAVTLDEMKKDIRLIKQANANAIRTSHYPNDPRFLQLCSEYGIYIIDEADIETHGMGYEVEGEWDWTRWSLLSTSPEWRQAYIDRAALLYERDKNSPCVVMWSLGNESGVGVNHRAMAQYIRSRDASAIIHYENSHKEFKAIPDGECFADISDVESRMYAGVGYIEQYLKDKTNTKPFFMCEYVCSMSTGDVYDYFRFADEYDSFCGGCIWELCDHAVNVPDENGKARYYYGGDFADKPNDGICCVDGLVYPDRRPRPGYYDMKKVYEPFSGLYKSGCVTIRNRRDFTSLDDLYVHWSVEADGEALLSDKCNIDGIAAGKEKLFKLFDEQAFVQKENCFITLSFRQKEKNLFADEDFELGFLQYEIGIKANAVVASVDNPIEVSEDDRYVRAEAGKTEIVFDKKYGCLCTYKKNGVSIIKESITFDIWRAPNYNGGSKNRWYLERFDRIKQKTYSATVSKESRAVHIEAQLALGAHSCPPVIHMTAKWSLFADGSLTVECNGTVRENAPVLPHLGLKLTMPSHFESVNYFGLGEIESYPDRCHSARFGEYATTVDGMYEHYIRPQECANRYKTRRMDITADDGTSVTVSAYPHGDFSFKALHYSAEDLIDAKHDFELTKADATYLNLDYRVNAISENSELDVPKNSRNFGDKTFSFGFRIK